MHHSSIEAPLGAILAGGQSMRMGQPKHAMRLDNGRLMIEHVVDALQPLCSGIVLLGDVDRTILPRFHRIADLRPGQGPLSGIEALLASRLGESFLVCPCDVPRVTPQLLQLLIPPPNPTRRTGPIASICQIAGRPDPEMLPLWIAAHAMPHVDAVLRSDRPSVWKLLQRLGEQLRVVTLDASCGPLLANINTPQDVASLQRE